MTDSPLTVCVVGNPNCGKSTLFNALTGARQQVGNWPGVTVERKTGSYTDGDLRVSVVDLPGIYSMGVTSSASVDERIARDFVLSGEADLVINIVDASNLERNLYLTTQLLEMRVPMVVALNMTDVARARGIVVDTAAMAAALGCPVVEMSAHRRRGVGALRDVIREVAGTLRPPAKRPCYGAVVEQAIGDLKTLIEPTASGRGLSTRWLAIKLLEGDEAAREVAGDYLDAVGALEERIFAKAGEDADILIADGRYGFANALIGVAVQRPGEASRTMSERIDRVVLNRILGIPIFLFVMHLLFMFSVKFASAFIDFFDQFFAAVFVDGLGAVMTSAGAPAWLITILADGIGGGIQTVATFIPVIACLFLFLSFLEDSGYMARAAFVMDRFMRSIGLPGKSFIPLIVGFGCNVPAIMASRTLEHRRDRIVTVMMAPFMSCGARLPVYALFAVAFFPTNGHNLVFALYLIGIAVAVMTGLVLRTTVLKGETSPFVMELPPYHLPRLGSMVGRTWDRLKGFVFRAGQVIVPMVAVLSVLASIGTDGTFNNEDSDRSVLASIGRTLTPAFAPMGIEQDNWPATVGLAGGILAKEAVVGTLNALYGSLDAKPAASEQPAAPVAVWAGIQAAFATIPDNIAALADGLLDPLGAGQDQAALVAQAGGVDSAVFGAMATRFDGRIGAFAYLLAVLLYMPCAASMAAIYRETGAGWTAFAAAWTTGLAYGGAVLAYQAGTFTRHPESSAAWIVGIAVTFAAAILILRQMGSRAGPEAIPATAAE